VPRRRAAVLLLAATMTVVLWLVAGSPWWSPAAGLGAALLVRLLGRLLPGRLRRPVLAGGVAGILALAPLFSGGSWLLAVAGGLAVVVVAVGGTWGAGRGAGSAVHGRRVGGV
jgi:hypothetical protein